MAQAQFDLFKYPARAGYYVPGPSKEAALAIDTGHGPSLRERMLELFKSGWTGTADEAGHMLGVSLLSSRPRCAELHARNLIRDTGERRLSDGGRLSTVWGLA